MAQDRINGFDKWDVEDAARTLIRAEDIRNDTRKGYYSTVLKELDRQVKAAERAALVAATAKKLNQTFDKGKK